MTFSRFNDIFILGFFPFYVIFVILDDFLTILGNFDFGIFPIFITITTTMIITTIIISIVINPLIIIYIF